MDHLELDTISMVSIKYGFTKRLRQESTSKPAEQALFAKNCGIGVFRKPAKTVQN